MKRQKIPKRKRKSKVKYKRMKKPVDINVRPSWNSCSTDMNKYKLSRTE